MNTVTTTEKITPPILHASLLNKIEGSASENELQFGLAFPMTNDDGYPIACQPNILHFMKRFGIAVAYDEFSLKTFVSGVPNHRVLDDACFQDIYVALDFMGLRVPKDYLWSVLLAYARTNRKHAVREKFDRLEHEWDGKHRLDTWLIDYCGVEDTPYTRAVGAKFLIAAVRRVRDPGCKFDHVLIFEGAQGIGKSTIFRVLAYDFWFTDNLTIGLDPKEVIELTRGKLICELAELTNIGKRDVEAMKTFVTRQSDEARLAYGRETAEVPRQFVLGATTNRSRYLRDETGDRRFWMVETHGVVDTGVPDLPLMLDASGLIEVREQLWAEAAVRESAGEAIYLPPEIEAIARAEQAKRYDIDDRQQILEDLLEGKSGFAPNDELYAAIGVVETNNRHPGISKIVTAAMKRLGWTSAKKRVGKPGRQTRGWESPDKALHVLEFNLGNFEQVDAADYRNAHSSLR